MSITPLTLVAPIRKHFSLLKSGTLNVGQEEERDSIIEKPPQVTKMSYCSSSDTSSDKQLPKKRDIKRLQKDTLTQLKLAKDQVNGRLSLEKLTKDAKSPQKLVNEVKKALNVNKRHPMAVIRKLKFVTAQSKQMAQTMKKAADTQVVKKPTTKFQEFNLSQSRANGRRAQLEDLYKKTAPTGKKQPIFKRHKSENDKKLPIYRTLSLSK